MEEKSLILRNQKGLDIGPIIWNLSAALLLPGQRWTGISRSEERLTLMTLFTPSILSSVAVLHGAPCLAKRLARWS